jgi:undecaprenyl pyrophosphate phosphatase UppP
MAEIPKDMKFLLFGRGAKWHGRSSIVLDFLGIACLIIGIIGSAINNAIGLGAINWILIAIALWILGIWAWLTAYNAAKEEVK